MHRGASHRMMNAKRGVLKIRKPCRRIRLAGAPPHGFDAVAPPVVVVRFSRVFTYRSRASLVGSYRKVTRGFASSTSSLRRRRRRLLNKISLDLSGEKRGERV